MPTKKKESSVKLQKSAPAKKAVAKKSVSKQVISTSLVAVSSAPIQGRTVTHHRVVLHDTCKNCSHLPDNAGTMITALALLITALSIMVLVLATTANTWEDLAMRNYSNTTSSHSVARN